MAGGAIECAGIVADALDGLGELGAEADQFGFMEGREAVNDVEAFSGKCEEDFAAVVGGDLADNGLVADELIDDANRAMVADLQLLGQIANGEFAIVAISPYGEERLVLVGRKAFGNQQILAIAQELADDVAESRHGLVVASVQYAKPY